MTSTRQAPTGLPTSELIEGWHVFRNDRIGYEFSYPPQASISSAGPDGYDPNEVPPDIAFDYFARLERLYPGGLCVALEYEEGFVVIRAPTSKGGRFVTCGVTGIGDYDLIQKTETIVIDGRSYAAMGYEVRARDAAATFLHEFFSTRLEDGTHVQYGGSAAGARATYEGYLAIKEILVRILATYRQTAPPTCDSGWSQLYPGIFAVVTGGPGDPPNRVRAAPDTSAEIITQIDPGQIVLVLAGPTCAGDVVFWEVESDAIPGGLGWTAEGAGAEYYLAPYRP